MRGPLGNLMQQAQRMQENLKRAQEDLGNLEVTGQSGGGMVSVTLNGRHEAKRVRVEPSVLGDAEMLEDLLVAAINDANNKVAEVSQQRMAEVTGGMQLPGGLKLPF